MGIRRLAVQQLFPGVGDRLAVVQAFGVDAQKDFDTVPGPLGNSRRGDTGRQPE